MIESTGEGKYRYSFQEDRESHSQKNTLEYKPDLKPEERERTAWKQPEIESAESTQTITGTKPGQGGIVDLIDQLKGIETYLIDKINAILKANQSYRIPISSERLPDFSRAKEELGLDKGDFTLEDYVKALEERHTPAGDFLTAIAEKHFEGIYGDIDLELLQDYIEVKEEEAMIENFLRRSTFSILSEDPIDLNATDWDKTLYQKERQWEAKHNQHIIKEHNRNKEYQEAFLFNPKQLAQQKALRYQEEKPLRQVKAESNQLMNAYNVVSSKINGLNQFLGESYDIEEAVLSEENKKAVTTTLLSAIENGEITQELTQLNLLLTLAVDDANQAKHHYKHTLRDVYTQENRQKIMDELNVYQNLYLNDVLPLSHTLRFYETKPEQESSSLLLNVTKSMLLTATQQQERLFDWQTLQTGTTQLRSQKMAQVSEKEKARQEFHLVNHIIEKGDTE